MKKLLIAMTAAAVGTCAWATEGAGGESTEPTTPTTTTYFTETFAGWSNDAEAGYVTSVAAPWSYGTVAEDGEGNPTLNTADPQADELKVVNGALSLNTGSKVLRGAFGGSTVAIPNDGLYFKSTVTFKDPSDTLPTLGAQDKFALVVLDNVESFEAVPKLATTQTTNLFVIAQYGATSGTKRAYKLTIPTELDEDGNIANSITDLTADWLSTPKMIEVKAYNNVMADSEEARAGFLVSVGGFVCKVYASYPIVGDLIDFTDNGGVKFGMNSDEEYLGVAPTAITGSLQTRYTDDQLILSLTDNASYLASVDFQGQGDIDDVSLKDSTTTDFGPDSLVLNVAKTDGITFEPGTSALMYYANGGSVTIKFTVAEGFELSSPAATDENLSYESGVYTYVYTPTANNMTVTISAFKPVAEFNGTSYKSVALALQAAVKSGAAATITLKDSVTFGAEENYGLTISSGDITINLNGKTIQGGGTDEIGISSATITVYGGTLKIVDTAENGGGQVLAPNFSEEVIGSKPYAIAATAGMTTIEGGKIGLINGYDATLTLVGGTYTDVGATFYWGATEKTYGDKTYTATLTDSVWAVAEKVIVKYTVSATYDNTQVSVTDLTTGEVEANTVLSFSVEALTGFENVVVKAGETPLTLENGRYNWTVVADVTITITADAVVVGPSIDDKEGEIVVDEQTGNATIDTTNATVTVTGTVTGDVIVPPSVGTVKVTLAAGKNVKVYSGNTDITGAFTIVTDGGTTTIELDPDGKVGDVFVRPEMAAAGDGDEEMKAPLEVGTDVAVGVKTIPGLMYQLIRSDAPNGTFNGVGDAVKGTGAPVKLEDKNKPNGKGFYKVKVSQR